MNQSAIIAITCIAELLCSHIPMTQAASSKQKMDVATIEVVTGVSIAGIEIGMPLSEVRTLGRRFVPEGIERGTRHGWVSGPLLVLVDDAEKVVLVSADLRRTAAINIDGRRLSAPMTLPQIARQIPGCNTTRGSGGNVLTCLGPGGSVNFYDTFKSPTTVWLHLGKG